MLTKCFDLSLAASRILFFYFLLGSLCSLVPPEPFLGQLNLFPEIARSFAHFSLLGGVFGFTFGIFLLTRRRWLRGMTILTCSLALLGILGKRVQEFCFTSEAISNSPGLSLSILSGNMEFGQASTSKFLEQVQINHPDLIVLSEVTQKWLDAANLRKDYPYSFEIPGTRAEGMAVYSKLPVSDFKRLKFAGESSFAAIEGTLALPNDGKIQVLAIHAPPPHVNRTLRSSQQFFENLANHVHALTIPAVIAGDFNLSPFSPIYVDFIHSAQLQNSFQGRGWNTSWSYPPLPVFSALIDYVLARGTIQFESSTVLGEIGSDHRPVLARMKIPLL